MIERPDETHWCIRVSDTGRGIPKDAQNRIFEAFWQLDGSITREVNRGVGLGLSIVRQLATLLGGEITLESVPDQGATFTVTFPLNAK
jgi:two-component system sensor histidine kinase/response regulator